MNVADEIVVLGHHVRTLWAISTASLRRRTAVLENHQNKLPPESIRLHALNARSQMLYFQANNCYLAL